MYLDEDVVGRMKSLCVILVNTFRFFSDLATKPFKKSCSVSRIADKENNFTLPSTNSEHFCPQPLGFDGVSALGGNGCPTRVKEKKALLNPCTGHKRKVSEKNGFSETLQ